MSKLTDHVSYIKGLAEGMKLDTESNEGKIITKLLEVMEEMAEENLQLRKDLDELNEYVDSIDDDLAGLEEVVYDDDEVCDGDCENCSGCDEDDEDDEDDDDDRIVEYACPHCGAEMTFEVDNFDFDEDYLCPSCHKPLFPEEDPDEE